tara:strand:+ start:1702 stop:1929 length:228 start_codon:yes stop_codon:yes gene_type:complete
MKTNKEKTIYYYKNDPGYDTIKKITQGWFTILKTNDNRSIYLNEEGEYKLPINKEATQMFGIKMYGNIAIIGDYK